MDIIFHLLIVHEEKSADFILWGRFQGRDLEKLTKTAWDKTFYYVAHTTKAPKHLLTSCFFPLLQLSVVALQTWNYPAFVWGTVSLWMQPANACGPINVLWEGKEKVKLSYWIDWTFMKLKCALPPTSSHVEMTSRHLQRPVWNTAVRIPTFSQVLSCCPAGTIQLLNLLWVEQEGSFYRLQPYTCMLLTLLE